MTKYLLCLSALLFITTAHADDAWFVELGVQTEQDYVSVPTGISPDGVWIVGWTSDSAQGHHRRAFRWNAVDGFSDVVSNDNQSAVSANSISADGIFVAGERANGAALWNADGEITELLPSEETARAVLHSIAADGETAYGSIVDPMSASSAFHWTSADGIQTLPGLCDSGCPARAIGQIAERGAIFGASDSHDCVHGEAVVWFDGGVTPLGALSGSTGSIPRASNSSGEVIVGESFYADGSRPTIWVGFASPEALPGPDGQSVVGGATTISDDGSVIGGFAEGIGACLWIEGVCQSVAHELAARGVSTEGWVLEEVVAANWNGTIILGVGAGSNGASRGWIAYIPR
jgi:uncharacterized membrane protein